MRRLALCSPLLFLFAACNCVPPQLPAVRDLIAKSRLIRLACLDLNGDGRVDAADAGGPLPDLNGDGIANEADADLVRATDLALRERRPDGCALGQPQPDWQVSPAPAVDCEAGRGGLLVLGVGGGAVQLRDPHAAAGVRWMLEQIGEELSEREVAYQLASVAPGLNGTARPQPDAEAWATTYLEHELRRTPCLRAVLIGHSHGGTLVTAVAARLERDGLGKRVLLAVVVDRITGLYGGDTVSLPHDVPVLNIYQTNDRTLRGEPIALANVENWDASDEEGPEGGDRGGRLVPVDHVTIDNSPDVLAEITRRLVDASCQVGPCTPALTER